MNWGLWEWGYAAIILFIIFTLAFVAYVYPPNTYDLMTYHLPRVMHWAQDRSLVPYPTSIERQIQMQPLAELIILNLYVLSGTDRLFNFVQLGALLVSLIGVSSITSKLGLDSRLQIITVLLCISIPMGSLQATSTQNDLVSACWLVCFVSLGFSFIKELSFSQSNTNGSCSWTCSFYQGYCIYFRFTVLCLLRNRLLRKIKGRAFYLGAFIGVIALLINAGHYSRMWLVYQSLLGPTKDYRNEIININVMSSNAIRNITLNLIPSLMILATSQVNLYIRNWLQLLHKVTGLAPDDPRTSWPDSRTNVFDMVSTQRHEDNIGNPLHTGLTFLRSLFFSSGFLNTKNNISY